MFKVTRTLIGAFFLYIADICLPKELKAKKEEVKVVPTPLSEKENKVAKVAEERLAFTDLSSYVEELKKPINAFGASMSICHDLKNLSMLRKGPVRLSFSVTNQHDREGGTTTITRSSISGYKDKRWQRLKELNIDPSAILMLVEEMIEAMAQDGWGCMNDSFDQVNTYLSKGIKRNQAYVLDRCKALEVNGFVRLDVSVMMNTCPSKEKSIASMIPYIRTAITVKVARERPVESALTIYFNREQAISVKTVT